MGQRSPPRGTLSRFIQASISGHGRTATDVMQVAREPVHVLPFTCSTDAPQATVNLPRSGWHSATVAQRSLPPRWPQRIASCFRSSIAAQSFADVAGSFRAHDAHADAPGTSSGTSVTLAMSREGICLFIAHAVYGDNLTLFVCVLVRGPWPHVSLKLTYAISNGAAT
jgi:hypothetical protein